MLSKHAICLFFVGLSLALAPCADAIDAGMPGPPSSPTEVMVGVFVADIIDLNEVNENFQLELILMATWHDPRLAFDAEKEGSGEKIFQGPYQFAEVFAGWWPQLLILNEVGRGDFNAVKITVYADGQVRYAEQTQCAARDPDVSPGLSLRHTAPEGLHHPIWKQERRSRPENQRWIAAGCQAAQQCEYCRMGSAASRNERRRNFLSLLWKKAEYLPDITNDCDEATECPCRLGYYLSTLYPRFDGLVDFLDGHRIARRSTQHFVYRYSYNCCLPVSDYRQYAPDLLPDLHRFPALVLVRYHVGYGSTESVYPLVGSNVENRPRHSESTACRVGLFRLSTS